MSTTSEIVERLEKLIVDEVLDGDMRGILRTAVARLEELDGDDVLRWGSVNEHGEAPDGSVWRHITFNGEQYTIPFEVSHLLDLRRNKIAELERENARMRAALEPFVKVAIQAEQAWASGGYYAPEDYVRPAIRLKHFTEARATLEGEA